MDTLLNTNFEYLKSIEKSFVVQDEIFLNEKGWHKDIVSHDGQEKFILDYYRGSVCFSKYSFNKRWNSSYILMRIDKNPTPHTNPDGQIIYGDHIHIYTEEYGIKRAYPITDYGYSQEDNDKTILEKMLSWRNVSNIPQINQHLFS